MVRSKEALMNRVDVVPHIYMAQNVRSHTAHVTVPWQR